MSEDRVIDAIRSGMPTADVIKLQQRIMGENMVRQQAMQQVEYDVMNRRFRAGGIGSAFGDTLGAGLGASLGTIASVTVSQADSPPGIIWMDEPDRGPINLEWWFDAALFVILCVVSWWFTAQVG